MTKYKVTYRFRTTNDGKSTIKTTEFKVDPSITNKFIHDIDNWRSIEVLVKPKKWWEFWR